MPDVDKNLVKYLSKLSRIECTDEEAEEMTGQMKRVIEYVEQLSEVDTGQILPYSHMETQGVGSLRDDVEGEPLPRETFLENAPDQVGGMIRVPPVMKQNP